MSSGDHNFRGSRADRRKRAKITVELPSDLVDELRNAAYWLSGPPHRLTVTSIAEAALARELERIRSQLNDGNEFKERTSELRAGRPVGT